MDLAGAGDVGPFCLRDELTWLMVEKGRLGGHRTLRGSRSPLTQTGKPWAAQSKAALGTDCQGGFPNTSAESFLRLRTGHCESIHKVLGWGWGRQ